MEKLAREKPMNGLDDAEKGAEFFVAEQEKLPVAPAVMVADEILVEGSDIAELDLEKAICRNLGIPEPEQ